jgi:hypothetical protein
MSPISWPVRDTDRASIEFVAARSALLAGADDAARHAHRGEHHSIDAAAASQRAECDHFSALVLPVHGLHIHHCARHYHCTRDLIVNIKYPFYLMRKYNTMKFKF